jgi:hypothetical protein
LSIDRTKLIGVALRIHTRALSQVCAASILCVAIAPARADNTAVYVAPGPSTLISADMVRRSQDQSGTARKLGDLIGSSLKSPSSHATDVAVTTKCGHYQSATITYADGTAKTLNLSNAPASQKDLDQAKAAIPLLRIIDVAGCDP